MFDEALDLVHRAATAEVWHRGLTLARRGAVRVSECTPLGWGFVVAGEPPERRVSFTWRAWRCECAATGPVAAPCEHVVAAACTLHAVGCLLSQPPGLARATARKGVRLRSRGDELHLRVVELGEADGGGVEERTLVGDPEAGDPLLAAMPAGAAELRLTPENAPAIVAELARSLDVSLDGRPVRVDPTPLRGPQVAPAFAGRSLTLRGDTLRLSPRGPAPAAGPAPGEAPDPSAISPASAAASAPGLSDSSSPAAAAPRDLSAGSAPGRGASILDSSGGSSPGVATTPDPSGSASPVAAPPGHVLSASHAAPGDAAAPPHGASGGPSPDPLAAASRAAPGGDAAEERAVLEPRWHDDGTGYDVTFHAAGKSGEAIELPAEQVARAWRSGTRAIDTGDGDIVWLPDDWLERYGPILEQFAAARQATSPLPRWARPAAAELCRALDAPPPPELAGLAALAADFSSIPPASPPAGLRATLRDYQQRGVDWLCLLRDAGIGALLADDMGLGKTLQTLCALRGRTLVVAPTSTLHNWAAEIARFRPDLRAHVYHGPARSLDASADVTLTNYAVLRIDHKQLVPQAWDIVVLDEAQTIKEPTTASAAAAFALRARWRVALTGTPVENRLTELWSICHFLNPGLLGGRRDFVVRWARPIERGHARAAAELQARLRPFVLRRRKSEVARELPPRTEVVLRCALDPQERAVYDSLRAAARADLVRLAGGGPLIEALELLLRLRQAACHAALVPGQQATRSSKVDLLVEQLTEVTAAGHRALVFSQWTGLLDLVEPALDAAGLKFVRLDGSTQDRPDVVARFQAADGPPVMLVSLKAGGTGLNLTAADHVYLLDPWYNPAVEDQAADRAHRIGQERPVFVHRLVAEDTVEEKILELHEHKRALALAAIDGTQSASLTREDLINLLR